MDILLPFTVTGKDAYGVSAFLGEFFQEYVGYAGGEFLAEDVRLALPRRTSSSPVGEAGPLAEAVGGDECEASGPAGESAIAVTLRMWLAPYDLGVSQDFALECRPTGDSDIHEVHIHLTRLAGEVAAWKKANVLFMSNIRKQFLIWRTVPQAEKEAYAERTASGE